MIEVPVSSVDPRAVSVPRKLRRPWPNHSSVARVMLLLILLLLHAPSVGSAAPQSSGDRPSASHAAAPGDNDGDGIPDSGDPDDDNDGVSDSTDPDPYSAAPPPAETPNIIAPGQDTDHDGIENIMDPDDDNDKMEDDEDPAPFTPVPPVEEPPAPVEQPRAPVVEQPVIDAPSANPPPPSSLGSVQASEPAPVTSLEQPQADAPVVVALPSTGWAAEKRSPNPQLVASAGLAVALGAAGMVLYRQANRRVFRD